MNYKIIKIMEGLAILIMSLFITYIINTYYSTNKLIIIANTNGNYISGTVCFNNTNDCTHIPLINSDRFETNIIILPEKNIKHLYWIPLKQKYILSIKSVQIEKYDNILSLDLDNFSKEALNNTGLKINKDNGIYNIKAKNNSGLLFENLNNADYASNKYYIKLCLIFIIAFTLLVLLNIFIHKIYKETKTIRLGLNVFISLAIAVSIF
jgi:hypothetical protein